MGSTPNVAEALDSVAAGLSAGPYKVSRQVELANGLTADITASRTTFSWKGLVILSQHLVLQHVDNASVPDLQGLSKEAFRFGKKANRVPLLRGMQFGYMIIPVIIGCDLDDAALEYASQSPRKHWALFEYPVAIDLTTNRIEYFRGTAVWGAFFFSDLRRIVEKYVERPLSGLGIQRTS